MSKEEEVKKVKIVKLNAERITTDEPRKKKKRQPVPEPEPESETSTESEPEPEPESSDESSASESGSDSGSVSEEQDDEADSEVSISTTDILSSDPLYFILSQFFLTAEQKNIATILEEINQKLGSLGGGK